MARRNGVSERGEEVYVAALRLFREKGYHATSMQDIAGAVGLYKGSLYHYIGGKEELLVQVFERAMGSLVANVERIAADTSLAPRTSPSTFTDRAGVRIKFSLPSPWPKTLPWSVGGTGAPAGGGIVPPLMLTSL